jgi:hypothetical protein
VGRGLKLALSAGIAGALLFSSAGAWATPSTGLVISEIHFNPTGGDDDRQWIELYNGTGGAVNLSTYSLGWGRTSYATNVLQLAGIVPDGATWVVGGTTSDARNGFPVLNDPVELAANLGSGFNLFNTEGVGLFDVTAANITSILAPIHSVTYGWSFATTVLPGESGAPAVPVFRMDLDGNSPAGSSIEYMGGNAWRLRATPEPNAVHPSVPEPGTGGMVAIGLLLLRATRARRPHSH